MGYRIRPSERFSEEFKAAGAEQLDEAIAVLTTHPEGMLEAIHAARKNFKKLRSLYRLVADDVPVFRDRENARIRNMARTLSALRDATALVEVSRYLLEHARNDDERVMLERVKKILSDHFKDNEGATTEIAESVASAIATCSQALEALSRVDFKGGKKRDETRIDKGWRTLLKRARAAWRACENTTDTHLFHELRKRGQDYRHYLSLLRDLWPSAMHAKRVAASEMVDLLGHHNDLALLTSFANAHPHLFTRSEDIAHLLSAVIARQEALRQSALQLADEVFLDRPRDEARRIALLWRNAA
ncbi:MULTISPECIES: CHAD domain-containing protein [unclassified Rhizobium]|uniref:CHAD domain-containing protein n=1 Tax=unclassified Rhizobium TaxID=2613769 RepID=UPI00071436F5|nr:MULTISPECIES: CHAD domain-containing protein [unclassified Rhizobium]KQS89629.1 metal-binding protein [Rhizobium sp. Leaf391]KQS94909.1 metal-binding protein [Rhizobium sp. Leaf386]KQU01285.1 metal-binding protein [Rhizobium sp. Leaf453]